MSQTIPNACRKPRMVIGSERSNICEFNCKRDAVLYLKFSLPRCHHCVGTCCIFNSSSSPELSGSIWEYLLTGSITVTNCFDDWRLPCGPYRSDDGCSCSNAQKTCSPWILILNNVFCILIFRVGSDGMSHGSEDSYNGAPRTTQTQKVFSKARLHGAWRVLSTACRQELSSKLSLCLLGGIHWWLRPPSFHWSQGWKQWITC